MPVTSGDVHRAAGDGVEGRKHVAGAAIADRDGYTPAGDLAALAKHAGGDLAGVDLHGVADAGHGVPGARLNAGAAQLVVAVGARAGNLGGDVASTAFRGAPDGSKSTFPTGQQQSAMTRQR